MDIPSLSPSSESSSKLGRAELQQPSSPSTPVKSPAVSSDPFDTPLSVTGYTTLADYSGRFDAHGLALADRFRLHGYPGESGASMTIVRQIFDPLEDASPTSSPAPTPDPAAPADSGGAPPTPPPTPPPAPRAPLAPSHSPPSPPQHGFRNSHPRPPDLDPSDECEVCGSPPCECAVIAAQEEQLRCAEARTWGPPESCHPSPTATAPPVRHPDAHTQDHDGPCTHYRFPPGDHDHHVAD